MVTVIFKRVKLINGTLRHAWWQPCLLCLPACVCRRHYIYFLPELALKFLKTRLRFPKSSVRFASTSIAVFILRLVSTKLFISSLKCCAAVKRKPLYGFTRDCTPDSTPNLSNSLNSCLYAPQPTLRKAACGDTSALLTVITQKRVDPNVIHPGTGMVLMRPWLIRKEREGQGHDNEGERV